MKIQAKDCHQGGLFQMEPEPGTVEVNNLATGWRYTGLASGSGRLCISNGRISAYDSPELATMLGFTAQQARWRVASGAESASSSARTRSRAAAARSAAGDRALLGSRTAPKIEPTRSGWPDSNRRILPPPKRALYQAELHPDRSGA